MRSLIYPCWNRKKVLLIGAGGHAKVIIDLLRFNRGIELVGLVDKEGEGGPREVLGVPVIGTDRRLEEFFQRGIRHALVAVGSVGDNRLRKSLYERARAIGFSFINAVHPAAVVSRNTKFGEGNVVMAGAIIGPGVTLGDNIIVNTGAVIEHDCVVGDHVHIAPGAKIAGGVVIGAGSHIGIGAVIIQGKVIGENAIIGAGSVVIGDVPDNVVVIGVPGRVKSERQS